MVIVRWLLWI